MSSEGQEHRKLAAIMFTDMVGYTALTQRNEKLALELLEEHRRLLRELFPKFNGHEIETTGDGFLVEFASALEAARYAIEIQRALATRNISVPPERQIQLRIGIHVGDVVHKDGHVLGDGVNIAARIEPLAEPGGVCISRAVFDQIHNKISERLVRLGEIPLKNLAGAVELYRVEFYPKGDDAADSSSSEIRNPRTKIGQRSIAVLPFVNMSDDRENEFLSDGITEDLITALSKIKGLRVPARTSSFAFKGRNEDIRRIGQFLNVENVLEASVRKSGNRLRITAQLINVADGFHLWSERYDRDMKDVFEIQDEIVRAIVTALELQLVGQPDAPFVKRTTENTAAYQLYLQGREYWKQRGAGLKKALHYFELALLEDPNYSLAYAGLADTYGLLGFYDLAPCRDALAKAKAAAEQALSLDEQLAEGHNSLAFVRMFYDLDLRAAEKEFLRAQELTPNYAPARYWYATCLLFLGRPEEAIAQERRSIEIEPLSVFTTGHIGWTYLSMRQFEAAIPPLQKCLELNEHFPLGHWLLGQAQLYSGRPELALAELQKAVELSGRIPMVLSTLACALVAAGQTSRAREVLHELQARSTPAPVRSFYFAEIHAVLGEPDRAFACLQSAWEERDFWLLWLQADPTLDSLHGDPRFAALQRKLPFAK